jgi:hypothetical protein
LLEHANTATKTAFRCNCKASHLKEGSRNLEYLQDYRLCGDNEVLARFVCASGSTDGAKCATPGAAATGYVYVGDLCSNMRTRRRKPPLDVIVRQAKEGSRNLEYLQDDRPVLFRHGREHVGPRTLPKSAQCYGACTAKWRFNIRASEARPAENASHIIISARLFAGLSAFVST